MFNNNPKNLSQYHQLPAPSFKKYSKRKPLFLSSARFPIDYRIETGQQSPDPCRNELEENKATGKHRNLSGGVPEFGKMALRKFHAPPKPFMIPDSYDYYRLQRGNEAISKFKKIVTPVGFDRMLPRDNLMFNMNEGYNLRPQPEPSIIDKLAAMDIDIRKLRVKHSGGTSSSFMSDSTNSNSFLNGEGKSRYQGGYKTNDAVNNFFSEMHIGGAIAGH